MTHGPVLVTGAAGNLGESVVRRLAAHGHRVRASDLDTKGARRVVARVARSFPGQVEFAPADVTDGAAVRALTEGVSAVAHLAGVLPPVSERHPAIAQRVNVGGTRALVDALAAHGLVVPFVLASSCSVYGPGQAARGLATATSETEGTDAYTRSKLEAEAILRASALAWVVLRIGAAIEGSKAVTDPIVLRLMFEIRADQPIELVHGEDVAIAVHHAIERPAAHRRVFPLGGGASCRTTQRGLFQTTLDALGVRDLPDAAFGESPYYTCFLDDSESQPVLEYQHHDLDAIRRDVLARVGPFGPVLRLLGPLTARVLLRYSGPYHGAPPRPTWDALIASE